MTEEEIMAEAEARANMQAENNPPTEEDFQKAETEVRAEVAASEAILADEEAEEAMEENEAEVQADAELHVLEGLDGDDDDEDGRPWINNGAVVTLQLVTEDFVGDPVEAVEQIMLDIQMHGLFNRAFVVADLGDATEYIVKQGRVITPAEFQAALAEDQS